MRRHLHFLSRRTPPMALIDRMVLRDLAHIRANVAAIVLALAVAMTMLAGLEMGLSSLLQTRDHFTSQLRLADLEVRLLPEDVRNLPDWSDVAGIDRVESRLLMPGTLELGPGRTIAALTVFQRSPEPLINQLKLLEGHRYPAGATEQAVAERALASYGQVAVGRVLTVKIGSKEYRHEIAGIVSSPEFLVVAANPEYFLPEKGSLGVIYTSIDRVFESLGFIMVNDLLFTFKPGADREQVKGAILDKLRGRTLERVITADQQLSRKHIEMDDEIFRIFRPAFGLVLGLLAFALVVLNVNRLVRRQQREIGALLAIGYGPLRVTAAYLKAVLWLALVAIALGALGAVAFRNAFLAVYSSAHGLAHLERHLYGPALAKGAGYVLLIAGVSAAAATRMLWRATPRALMRPPPPPPVAVGRLLGPLSALLGRAPVGIRIGIRNVLRHRRLTATTVASVALALAVGVAYLVCLDSMGLAILRSFSDQKWNRALSFLYPTLDEEFSKIGAVPGVSGVEPFIRIQGQLATDRRALDTFVLGMKSERSLRSVNLTAGRVPRAPGEIVIGEDLARRLGLGLGAAATLQVRNSRYPVTVVGIKSEVLLGESLAAFSWAQQVMELADQATGVFVSYRPEADGGRIDREIQELEFVGRITLRERLVDDFKSLFQDIRGLVMLVAFIALLVAVLFVAVSMNMTAGERAGDLALLRALGFEGRIVRQIVVVEASVQLLLASLLMTPASYGLSVYLNRLASEAWFHQPTLYRASLVGVVSAVAVGLGLASLVLPIRRLQAMDVVGELRRRQIE